MNNDILALASRLILASTTGDDKELKNVSDQLAAELTKETTGAPAPALIKDFTGFLKFTEKEISSMPKAFRHTFIAEGKVICYRKRIRGRVSCSYEARYRRHGYNISVSATNLMELKPRFIEALHAAEMGEAATKIPTNFHEFAMYWFENFHKRKVKEATYNHDIKLYERHLKERLGQFRISAIIAPTLQKLLDEFSDRGKTADDIHSILNQIFNCAVNHGLIRLTPLGMIFHEKHEHKHGSAITKRDEQKLLQAFAGQPYQLHYAVILYTGLRPNEYPTATVDCDFIKAVNSKRHGKNGKVVYKRIPISPMLRPYLDGVTEISLPQAYILEDRFKKILPNHKLYDMRTTFQTRCSECGIPDNVIGVFMGNSIGKLKEAYTDFSEEYLIREGGKLKY